MNSEEYNNGLARLKEIESIVKDPESSLDRIDELLDETKKIVAACMEYTRGLKTKVESLEDVVED